MLRVDAGMFQCLASSPAGSATGSLRLVVLPPDAPDAPDAPDMHHGNHLYTHTTTNKCHPFDMFCNIGDITVI